jgi:hypothetical protein
MQRWLAACFVPWCAASDHVSSFHQRTLDRAISRRRLLLGRVALSKSHIVPGLPVNRGSDEQRQEQRKSEP